MRNDKQELLNNIALIRDSFENFNLDIIYNLPNQTDEIWQDDLYTVVTSGATHLTFYPLVLLENTIFYQDYVRRNKYPIPKEEREIEIFNFILNFLKKTEFSNHYSVRDWAKEGYACRYIQLNPECNQVLALGAGAHGFIAGMTYCNEKKLDDYHLMLDNNQLPICKQKICSDYELMQRYMVMGLRLLKRNMHSFKQKFGVDWKTIFAKKAEILEKSGFIIVDNDEIRFAEKGYTWANNVRTFFEESQGTSVGYTDTLAIGTSGKDHYSAISRVKSSSDVETKLL